MLLAIKPLFRRISQPHHSSERSVRQREIYALCLLLLGPFQTIYNTHAHTVAKWLLWMFSTQLFHGQALRTCVFVCVCVGGCGLVWWASVQRRLPRSGRTPTTKLQSSLDPDYTPRVPPNNAERCGNTSQKSLESRGGVPNIIDELKRCTPGRSLNIHNLAIFQRLNHFHSHML